MKSNFVIAIVCAALFGGLTGAKLALRSRHASPPLPVAARV